MLIEQVGEDLHARVERAVEVFLLGLDDAGDVVLLLAKLGVLALVFMDDGVDHFIEEGLVHAEELAVAGGASE